MFEKLSYYEYFATYVDDIITWIMDLVAIVTSLKKTYMIMSKGIPEYYLGGNVEILGDV
jgi:hypothetical protein